MSENKELLVFLLQMVAIVAFWLIVGIALGYLNAQCGGCLP